MIFVDQMPGVLMKSLTLQRKMNLQQQRFLCTGDFLNTDEEFDCRDVWFKLCGGLHSAAQHGSQSLFMTMLLTFDNNSFCKAVDAVATFQINRMCC